MTLVNRSLANAGRRSAGLNDLAGLDAARADIHALRRTIDDGANTLNVWIPTTLGASVRVRHTHAPRWALATQLTYRCHLDQLLLAMVEPVHLLGGNPRLPFDIRTLSVRSRR